MKLVRFFLIFLLCFLMAGCSNEFAESEYESTDLISQEGDRYAKVGSLFTQNDGEYLLKVSQFDGRQTLWSSAVEVDQEIEIELSLKLSAGKAKIVHIDGDGEVHTLIECSRDTITETSSTLKIQLITGKNRVKIVGYDCEDVEVKMIFSQS